MKTKTERMSPGEYERRYADACVKADVVPAPLLALTLREEDDVGDEPEDKVPQVHLGAGQPGPERVPPEHVCGEGRYQDENRDG